MANAKDRVDRIIDQWDNVRPDLDVTAMGVIGRINRIAIELDRHIGSTLAEYGLHRGEFDILATLLRSGQPYRRTVGELGADTMVTSGAVTHRLNSLADKNLIERDIDANNRRVIIVSLTATGLETVTQALEAHVANETQLISALSPEQTAELANSLRALLVSFGDI